MTAPTIVLLTDFGLSDAYVGMMHGVIHGTNPAAHVIDLTHGIGAQDVRHGAVVLADSYRYFPDGTMFVAVVDPGVGTDRAAILLETPHARYVAPDNGLLTLVCRHHDPSFGDTDTSRPAPVPPSYRAWRLTNPDYWRHPVSNTFHGRDVFAPVAAHLSLDVPPDALGDPAPTITALALPIPRTDGNTTSGQVIFADAFGNLVTDITTDLLGKMGIAPGDPSPTVTISGHTITGLSRTFHSLPSTGHGDPPGAALQCNRLRALIGSHGRLEIAVMDGNAAAMLKSGGGAPVSITGTAGARSP